MSTAYERRVRRLREHVLANERKRKEELKKVLEPVEEVEEELSIDYLTKDEIIEKLREKGIDHNPRDKKETLFKLLVGD